MDDAEYLRLVISALMEQAGVDLNHAGMQAVHECEVSVNNMDLILVCMELIKVLEERKDV